MKTLVERAEKVRAKEVDKKVDNMLKISTDGRKAALDLRMVQKEQPTETSKIERCVDNVMDIYYANPGSSQLIFCDYSTPKTEKFDVYHSLKERLIEKGIPKEEIAFIHSYHTEERKVALFKNVNEGKVKILIGSTFKLGIGANVQTVLKAIHHLDVPWRPADMIQREGRILRRGNTHKNVFIYRYICEGSFDAYSWQILESKQRFISQFLSGNAYQRSSEDLEENVLNFAEVKALALADPRMKELAEKENKLGSLRILAGRHRESQEQIKEDITRWEKTVRTLSKQIEAAETFIPELKEKGEKEYKQLREKAKVMFENANLNKLNQTLGMLWKCTIQIPEIEMKKPTIYVLINNERFCVELGDTAQGNAIRISHFFERLLEYIQQLAEKKNKNMIQIEEGKKLLNCEKPYVNEIHKLSLEIQLLKNEIEVKQEI